MFLSLPRLSANSMPLPNRRETPANGRNEITRSLRFCRAESGRSGLFRLRPGIPQKRCSREEYYRLLGECSRSWHQQKNDIVPWWNYFLAVIRTAYKDFQQQVESASARPAKSDLVRRTILEQAAAEFTLADLAAQLPTASTQLIKKVLSELKKKGNLRLVG